MAGILYWKISRVVMVITSEILNLSRVAYIGNTTSAIFQYKLILAKYHGGVFQ